MHRWTTSHPIPLSPSQTLRSKELKVCSVAAGKDVLLFLNERDGNIQLFVFQTDTGNVKEFVFKEFDKKLLESVNFHDGKVYIWISNGGSTHILYKLDTETMKIEEVMRTIDLKLDFFDCDSQIINGLMYVFEYDANKLYVINLETKKVTNLDLKEEKVRFGNSRNLVVHNGKLYILVANWVERIIAVIENDGAKILNSETIESRNIDVFSGWMNDTALNRCVGQISLDTFDFELSKWSKLEVENVFDLSDRILATVKIDDNIYAITDVCIPGAIDERKLEIRVLETKPSLTTICLFDIIDSAIRSSRFHCDLPEDKNVELVRGNFSLKPRFDALYEWRLKKKKEEDCAIYWEALKQAWETHD